MLPNLIKELQEAANLEHAEILQRFFKTGEGQYGEGDIFLGIKSPVSKSIVKKYYGLSLPKIQKLLDSKVHEHRGAALSILVNKFKRGNEEQKGNIFNFYLKNTKNINNWDLVDLTASNIVGEFLFDKNKDKIYELAQSKDLWEKRIAMISCFAYIRKEEFKDALRIAEILLNDKHDLIHKAVGWMLREIGKKDQDVLENFLKKHYKNIPRTTLRYSIERFEEDLRKKYLMGRYDES